MKKPQLQKAKRYVVGMALSLLAACSSQPETVGTTTDPTADTSSEPNNEGSSGPNQKLPMATDDADKFIGEWKSVQSEGRDHTIITRNGGNFLIQQGKKTVPGVWDEENNIIRMNVGMPMDIMYIENEDMIVFGSGGKYRRVSEK
ncbi:hypothetical protein ACFSC6_10530 [Rufibacter sediminis]|uniref:Lipocalin-like domain-containing protein n=1 Tax=Rufibacter sediminis TaxID=2762756 RepID=A0ABR6VP41_9BACT|nr:hypothetical protein [Rufibacter sediminis]MBC3538970.1 hypothetical protein [Rufibacter sediminis]